MSEHPLDSHEFAQENPYGQSGPEGQYQDVPGAFGADVSKQLDDLFDQPPVDANTILDVDPRDIVTEPEPLYGDGGRSYYGDTQVYGPDDWLRDRTAMASEKRRITPTSEFDKDTKFKKENLPEDRYTEDRFYLSENVAAQAATEAALAPPSDSEWLAVKEERRKRDLRRQAAVRTASRATLIDAGIISPEVEEAEHPNREKASRRATSPNSDTVIGETKSSFPQYFTSDNLKSLGAEITETIRAAVRGYKKQHGIDESETLDRETFEPIRDAAKAKTIERHLGDDVSPTLERALDRALFEKAHPKRKS